jgi:hypothetical protein
MLVVKSRLVERDPKVAQLEGALEVLTKAFPSHQPEKTRVSEVDQDAQQRNAHGGDGDDVDIQELSEYQKEKGWGWLAVCVAGERNEASGRRGQGPNRTLIAGKKLTSSRCLK